MWKEAKRKCSVDLLPKLWKEIRKERGRKCKTKWLNGPSSGSRGGDKERKWWPPRGKVFETMCSLTAWAQMSMQYLASGQHMGMGGERRPHPCADLAFSREMHCHCWQEPTEVTPTGSEKWGSHFTGVRRLHPSQGRPWGKDERPWHVACPPHELCSIHN